MHVISCEVNSQNSKGPTDPLSGGEEQGGPWLPRGFQARPGARKQQGSAAVQVLGLPEEHGRDH